MLRSQLLLGHTFYSQYLNCFSTLFLCDEIRIRGLLVSDEERPQRPLLESHAQGSLAGKAQCFPVCHPLTLSKKKGLPKQASLLRPCKVVDLGPRFSEYILESMKL